MYMEMGCYDHVNDAVGVPLHCIPVGIDVRSNYILFLTRHGDTRVCMTTQLQAHECAFFMRF